MMTAPEGQSSQPMHVPSRILHHPTNPLYSISILSHLFSIPCSCHFSSHVLQPSHIQLSTTAPRLWNDLPPELRTIYLPPPPSFPITRHHLPPPPLSVAPGPSTQS